MDRLRLSEVPPLLRTPVGRWLLMRAAVYRAWPMLRILAVAWRRVVIRRTRIVAVVGSLGKSTTAHAVSTVLGSGREMAVLSNQFGFLAAKILAIRPGQPWAVIEVGVSAPGQMRAYADLIRPDITIVTSVAGELRIYCTPIPAADRRPCLMQDALYRLDVAMGTMGYHQVPMLSTDLATQKPR